MRGACSRSGLPPGAGTYTKAEIEIDERFAALVKETEFLGDLSVPPHFRRSYHSSSERVQEFRRRFLP